MKTVIEFNLPDELQEYTQSKHGPALARAVRKFSNYLDTLSGRDSASNNLSDNAINIIKHQLIAYCAKEDAQLLRLFNHVDADLLADKQETV